MKTREILISILVVLLVFSGCREITVTTQVHKDGTFTRTILITGDSSSVFRGDLPYPVDSTWQRVATKDTTKNDDKDDDDDYILTYKKTYRNSDELNAEIHSDTSWRRLLQRKITISDGFGFFYSYPRFKEVFQPLNPFTYLNYQDYISEDDLLWLTGKKDVISHADTARLEQAEESAEDYLAASITAEVSHILVKGLATIESSEKASQDVSRYYDSIYQTFHRGFSNGELSKNFINLFAEWSENDSVLALNALDPPLFEEFNKKMSFFDNLINMESYPEKVEMPGVITETNSVMLKGNQVSWEVQPSSILFEEYELSVESRVVNNWAFIVTGIILLLLIIVMIVKAFKK